MKLLNTIGDTSPAMNLTDNATMVFNQLTDKMNGLNFLVIVGTVIFIVLLILLVYFILNKEVKE
jgi:hypothetical protein